MKPMPLQEWIYFLIESIRFQSSIQPLLFQQKLRQFKIINRTYAASARALLSKKQSIVMEPILLFQ
jgi:hypothetical protein